jgi:acyl-CoA synthetase (AMP-forming)/AMP-acid ligase II
VNIQQIAPPPADLEHTEFVGRRAARPSPAIRIGEASTLVELLRDRVLQQPGLRIYTYLADGEVEGASLTLAALHRQAQAIGALLQSYRSSGERALLLYPSGLEFIPAFFGCLYAGVIAVPLPLPNMVRPQRTLTRFRAVANDAQATLVLTTAAILGKLEGLFAQSPELQTMRWLATDQITIGAAQDWRDPGATVNTVALLQYTSGSTATPRGVIVSHRNLLENSANISRAFEIADDAVSVTWLPVFHDMGLNNGIVQPLYGGRQCILMPPQSFLQRPMRWLQAISDYQANISGGPNFAYEMCARKATADQLSGLDLSRWQVAYTGAEPVRADTLQRFAATFASCGFRTGSFYPCYGLAEATLIVSGGTVNEEPILCTTRTAALEHNNVVEASGDELSVRTLVGCGRALPATDVVIVHPESLTACAPDEVGEIWVSSLSVAQGYWNRPEETELTFLACRTDTGEGPFLRTGDLGFLRGGELFVTGRMKDLIIIGGRNLYPHDLELTVEQCHAAIRSGGCVAFSVDVADEERLIIAAEIDRRYQPERHQLGGKAQAHSHGNDSNERTPADQDDLVRAIRRAIAEEHDVRVHAVVLMSAGGIPKTPSGKVQRRVCETRYRDGTLARSAKIN